MAVDYIEDSKINKLRLDEECARQPELMARYGVLASQASSEYDQAMEALDRERARMACAIRRSPAEYDLPKKFTEAAVRDAVVLTPEYQRALRVKNAALREKELTDVALKAICRKEKSLDTLARLHGQSYFGGLGDDVGGKYGKARKAGEEQLRKELDGTNRV